MPEDLPTKAAIDGKNAYVIEMPGDRYCVIFEGTDAYKQMDALARKGVKSLDIAGYKKLDAQRFTLETQLGQNDDVLKRLGMPPIKDKKEGERALKELKYQLSNFKDKEHILTYIALEMIKEGKFKFENWGLSPNVNVKLYKLKGDFAENAFMGPAAPRGPNSNRKSNDIVFDNKVLVQINAAPVKPQKQAIAQ